MRFNDWRKRAISAAELAVEMYCYRVKKYIGAYYAALGRIDALVFTAGIGENSATIRQRACAGLDNFGIIVDESKNRGRSSSVLEIQSAAATVKVLVIPANEEVEIAQQTAACIGMSD